MKKSYLIILLILMCCFMNQILTGQELVKIWEQDLPSLEIEQTANLQRNPSHMDLDGDGGPDLVGFNSQNETIFIKKSSGENVYIPYTLTNVFLADYTFAGFYSFFPTENGLKQMLMIKKAGPRIIGILVGVVGEDEIDFDTPIPAVINDSNSVILNIKNYNSNNFEEIKVTYANVPVVELWEWQF